jgi:hypothetical protein
MSPKGNSDTANLLCPECKSQNFDYSVFRSKRRICSEEENLTHSTEIDAFIGENVLPFVANEQLT